MPPKKKKDESIDDEIAKLKASLLKNLGDPDLSNDGDGDGEDEPPPKKKPKGRASPTASPPRPVSSPPPATPPAPPPPTPSSAKWQVQLAGNWQDFPEDQGKLIEVAYAAHKTDITLPPCRGQVYRINFGDMTQENTATSKKRSVRRLSDDKPQSPSPGSSPTPISGSGSGTNNEANADETPPPLETATFTLIPVNNDSEEFWALEEKFNSHIQGRNEDYVAKRLEKGLKPISFVLKSAERISNPVLEKRFAIQRAKMAQVITNKVELRERTSFHGSHPKNLPSICKTSLLRFKHSLNPCASQVDDGYFGTNKKGVYVSRYADYTVKYSNRQVPLEPGETCKIVMFRTLPGRSKHIPKLVGPIDPTEGFDSHSSPSYLEWYLFNEDQLCPEYILTILAREDTRTASDDQ